MSISLIAGLPSKTNNTESNYTETHDSRTYMIGPFRSSIATGIRAVPRGFDPARIPSILWFGTRLPEGGSVSKGLLALSSALAIVAAGLRHRSGRAFAHDPVVRPEQLAYRNGGQACLVGPRQQAPIVEKADLILITHDHADHYSPADIKKLSGPTTIVLVGFDGSSFPRIRPGDRRTFGDLSIEALPAYNVVKTQFHPKSAGYCGFILSAGALRLYDAGDTERIPEMKGIDCDVLSPAPRTETYTMGW